MVEAELPDPPSQGIIGYLKMVGPGVILGSLAIGSGEWILFPALVVKYGPYLLWAALLSAIIPSRDRHRVLEIHDLLWPAYP